MSSTVQRSFTRIVAPVVLVALLALLTAWQGGVRTAEGRAAATGTEDATIEVHGDWTVDVHAADGELVAQQAFSNALTNRGGFALAALISGESTLLDAPWITFDCGKGTQQPEDWCWIHHPGGFAYAGVDRSDDLEVESDFDAATFALRGSMVAPRDFTLGRVGTWVRHRVDATALTHVSMLTQKVLPVEEQIEIMEGQTIVIRVELSFS